MRSRRALPLIVAGIMLMSIFSGLQLPQARGANGSFGGGDGTAGNPYIIEDVWDLQNMSGNLNACYALKNDINASATAGWNGGAGFIPVSNLTSKFKGLLDGGNFTISGLSVNRSTGDYLGLFGFIDYGGAVRNIRLAGSRVSGDDYIGGLAGQCNGIIENTKLTGNGSGTVDIAGDLYVGGLVGLAIDGSVNRSCATANVTGGSFAGGLVGYFFNGTVNDSMASGNVSVAANSAGGLIGRGKCTVSNSSASGNVSGTGNFNGGLVGYDDGGTIDRSCASGNVNGTGDFIGGLVGRNNGTVKNSSASGRVKGDDYIGGLVGRNNGTVQSSFASGHVDGNTYVGGLVGTNYGTVNHSHATGDTAGTDYNIGGLAGSNPGTVTDSYALGNVTGISGVGGLVGRNDGSVESSHASGEVASVDVVGGLVGYSYEGAVNGSYATGNVTGTGNDVGGLLGGNTVSVLNNSYATGNVTGGNYVGGLVGDNNGFLDRSHSCGNVTGVNYTGGLVGNNLVWVKDSYSLGNVTGERYVGGLIGFNYNRTVVNSHYNIDDVLINGGHHVSLGGIFDGQYQDWLSSGLALNISEYNASLVPMAGCYDIHDAQGFRDMLGFSDATGCRFRLAADIDLSSEPGLYVPYLRAEFDGQNHTILNLSINLPFGAPLAMFGQVDQGTIKNTMLNGSRVAGYDYVGGLVGYDNSTVTNCHVSGSVNGSMYVGGLAGYIDRGGINDSQAAVQVTGREEVGGMAGFCGGTVCNVSSTGNVTGGICVGGLAGYSYGTVQDASAAGNVSGNGHVGGLVGYNDHYTVINSHASGNVTATGSYAGGLVGHNYFGGVNDSQATGSVNAAGIAGGLVGRNYKGTVLRSFATGDVNASGSESGGLVGRNDNGTVNNTYATGNVTGGNCSGGLVGVNDKGRVNCSYAAGNVTGGGIVGGLAAYNNATIWSCFWDKEASGQNSSSGGTGKTTSEMKVRSTFTDAGWNFTGVWCIVENVTYPLFLRQDTQPPIAEAGPNRITDEDVLFTFNGSGSSDNVGISNYTWTFTDGAPVALYGVQPQYLFNNPGVFTVTLKVTDSTDRWDTDAATVTVRDITPPSADAGANQTVERGTLVSFNASGCSDNVGIANYTWTLSDGIAVQLYGVQPQYRFNAYGLFNVILNVTDAAGNRASDAMTVAVTDMTNPIADAGFDQTVDAHALVTFNGTGSSDNAGIVNLTWNFSDGAPVMLYGAKPSHTFDNLGVFLVTLNVTDAAGNWNMDTMTVTVRDATVPVASAGPDQVADEDAVVTFDGSGSSDNVGIVDYTWKFTDAAPVTLGGMTPKYTFNNPGIFVVALNVTDAAGNRDTDTVTVTVRDITRPSADAGPDMVVNEDAPVAFNGSGSSDNLGIVNFTWNFTDGTVVMLYGAGTEYIFQYPGCYTVTLKTIDAAGNWAVDIVSVTVNDITAPSADAGADLSVDEGALVTFDGSQSFDNVGVVNYSWTLTDGAMVKLHGPRPAHRFDNPGIFTVELNVTDVAGNWQMSAVNITVCDTTAPVADAGRDRLVPAGNSVVLDGELSADNVGIGTCSWNFTYDGKTKSLEGKVVSFVFDKGGIFEIILTVFDRAGNKGNDTVVVTVVDTGTVTGTALDPDGRPVEGAAVEITASDGETCTTQTAADGTFAARVFHGPFGWKISKSGYHAISGNSSVGAMNQTRLDLPGMPAVKNGQGTQSGNWPTVALLVAAVAAAACAGGYILAKRKRTK